MVLAEEPLGGKEISMPKEGGEIVLGGAASSSYPPSNPVSDF